MARGAGEITALLTLGGWSVLDPDDPDIAAAIIAEVSPWTGAAKGVNTQCDQCGWITETEGHHPFCSTLSSAGADYLASFRSGWD